jgi:hypothetical protein
MYEVTLWRKGEQVYTSIRQQRIWGASDVESDRTESANEHRLRKARAGEGCVFAPQAWNFPVQVPFTSAKLLSAGNGHYRSPQTTSGEYNL